jgi:hypothetical protein
MSHANLSRRAIVAGAASVPALALPAVAANAIGNPDAELLELGIQLEAAIQEWATQCAIDRRRRDEHEAACERAGFPRIDIKNVPREEMGGWRAYQEKRDAFWPIDETGVDGVDVWDEINDRQNPIVDDILSRKPRTIAGLAVQAKAMVAFLFRVVGR